MIGPLYHWSPRDRLNSIKRMGLVPGHRNINGPTWHGLTGEDEGLGEYRQDSISLSPNPGTAWNYSHGTWRTHGTFDLWMVHLEPEDEVHVLPFYGTHLVEVRVKNRIPKRRLIWIGERHA